MTPKTFNQSLVILTLALGAALITSCNQNLPSDVTDLALDARAAKPQAPMTYSIAETSKTALATGRKAWFTGRKAWFTGNEATLVDNLAVWNQIHLQQAQTLAPDTRSRAWSSSRIFRARIEGLYVVVSMTRENNET